MCVYTHVCMHECACIYKNCTQLQLELVDPSMKHMLAILFFLIQKKVVEKKYVHCSHQIGSKYLRGNEKMQGAVLSQMTII